MNKKLLLLTFLAFTLNFAKAQWDTRRQYFDGNDTIPQQTFEVHIDTTGGNVWQIGPPQKILFDSAATVPNVLVTDTINTYPPNDTSSFIIGFDINYWYSNLYKVAFRWTQKLDLDTKRDGGMVEYSLDTGQTWVNVFNNPNVFNFYGFDSANNKDTLMGGEYAFSGTDTVWRDIWLCFSGSIISQTDSFMLRYTLISDSTDNSREGWMIDNMMAQPTYYHTVSKIDPAQTFLVYPTITTGVLKIDADVEAGEIESIYITDINGRLLREYKHTPVKTSVDISMLPAGTYYVRVGISNKAEIHKVVLIH
jgi:hypothetical protein